MKMANKMHERQIKPVENKKYFFKICLIAMIKILILATKFNILQIIRKLWLQWSSLEMFYMFLQKVMMGVKDKQQEKIAIIHILYYSRSLSSCKRPLGFLDMIIFLIFSLLLLFKPLLHILRTQCIVKLPYFLSFLSPFLFFPSLILVLSISLSSL